MIRIILGSVFGSLFIVLCLFSFDSYQWYQVLFACIFWGIVFGSLVFNGIKSVKEQINHGRKPKNAYW
jgi:hypothetical protein